ncbi:haloacid dehalogenase type II [Phytohalomonas tamaricis]|uniref:haloacid dehalogenase type II n=1 Tax=Phytohalomonas tamaricis TaxID=2081032 RepID=UPI000D0B3593|nr:haloacid dehalogenase type II [Phytohalomonas tamaricis]
MPRHIVFDINETLLDVAALDPFFIKLFDDSRTRTEWFLTLEENWLTATILERYKPFGELAQAALVMVGQRRGIEIAEEVQQELAERLKQLPAHEDVHEALKILRESSLPLVALTNGTLSAVQQQLQSAGLHDYFVAIMSVDEVQRYKPAPEPYQMVAKRMNIATSDMLMVAAHAWDIAGAASAGCRTAFVTRPGKVLNPAGILPNLKGEDLVNVARQIVAQEAG